MLRRAAARGGDCSRAVSHPIPRASDYRFAFHFAVPTCGQRERGRKCVLMSSKMARRIPAHHRALGKGAARPASRCLRNWLPSIHTHAHTHTHTHTEHSLSLSMRSARVHSPSFVKRVARFCCRRRKNGKNLITDYLVLEAVLFFLYLCVPLVLRPNYPELTKGSGPVSRTQLTSERAKKRRAKR